MEQGPIQVRSEQTGIKFLNTLNEAFEFAKKDRTIWKISFDVGEERLRLIRKGNEWVVEQLDDAIAREYRLMGKEYVRDKSKK